MERSRLIFSWVAGVSVGTVSDDIQNSPQRSYFSNHSLLAPGLPFLKYTVPCPLRVFMPFSLCETHASLMGAICTLWEDVFAVTDLTNGMINK